MKQNQTLLLVLAYTHLSILNVQCSLLHDSSPHVGVHQQCQKGSFKRLDWAGGNAKMC